MQRNIAAFGGDKDNVTFGGQSAGAVDMMAHLVSPLTEGLFHKAIYESYCSAIFPFPAKDVAEANGVAFAQAAGCGAGSGPDVARCLRNLPASKILELSGTESARSRFTYNTPIMDGQIIPDQPITLFSNGPYHRVPLLNGAVKDEGNFPLAIIAYFSNPRSAVTLEQYLKYTEATYVPPAYPEGTAAKVLAAYPLDTFKSPMAAWDRSTSDWALCNMRHLDLLLARSIPVYTYEFADQTAPSYFPDMPGVETLAFHTVDIQYIFPLWHGGPLGRTTPLDPAQTKLSDQIVSAWTNFARSGNPNGSGDTPWPRFKPDVQEATWLIQDLPAFSTITDQKFSSDHRCDLWDAVTR